MIERFGASDAHALQALTQAVGWPHTLADWQDFLALGAVIGHRDANGVPHTCSGLYQYGSVLSSIGVVVVRPEWRGRGLGRAVTQRCIDASTAEVLSLIATPFGLPVYERMGFQTISTVHRMMGELNVAALPARRPHAAATSITSTELPAIIALEAKTYGASRDALLRRLHRRTLAAQMLCGSSPERSDAPGRDSAPRAFGFALQKIDHVHIGPVIAPDVDGAAAVIAALANAVKSRVRIDVPHHQHELRDLLLAAGLSEKSVDPVMTMRGVPLPGDRTTSFGIAFQAYG